MDKQLIYNPVGLVQDLVGGETVRRLLAQGFEEPLRIGDVILAGNGLLVSSPVHVTGEWHVLNDPHRAVLTIGVRKGIRCQVEIDNNQVLDGRVSRLLAREFQATMDMENDVSLVNIDGVLRGQDEIPAKNLSARINQILVQKTAGPFRVIGTSDGRECQMMSTRNTWITFWRAADAQPHTPPWLAWGTPEEAVEIEPAEEEEPLRSLSPVEETAGPMHQSERNNWEPPAQPDRQPIHRPVSYQDVEEEE